MCFNSDWCCRLQVFTQSKGKPYQQALDGEVQKLGQLHWRLGDYTVGLASLQHSKEKLISVSSVNYLQHCNILMIYEFKIVFLFAYMVSSCIFLQC